MEERRNVPKLRFPGFTDPWEQRRLGEIVDVRSGKDYKHLKSGPIPVYGTGGLITYVDDALSKNEDAVGIGRKGTIDQPYKLYAPFWTVDTLFYAVPKAGSDIEFVLCCFQRINWKAKDESTGLPSLSKRAIDDTQLLAPRSGEQSRIGALFAKLDSLIALHQRELDHVKELKKGLLQKMFPKEGTNVPELRFPGFTDPWEQRRLGEVASFGGGHTPSMADLSNYENGSIPWVTSQDVKTQYLSRTKTLISDKGAAELNLYPAGSLVVVVRSGILRHTLPVAELRKPMTVNQDIRVIVPAESLSARWLLGYFEGHDKELLLKFGKVGTTVESINFSEMKSMALPMPSTTEQSRIGALFAKLDSLIALHQRELDHVKELKKGLLQQMFV